MTYVSKNNVCNSSSYTTECCDDNVVKELTVFPLALDFHQVEVGQQSLPQNIIITNTGNTTVDISSITIAPNNFLFSGTIPDQLAKNEFINLSIVFQAVDEVQYSGVLNIIAPGSTGAKTVTLTGTGVGEGVINPPINAVLYSPQTLTEEQQEQARENIGVPEYEPYTPIPIQANSMLVDDPSGTLRETKTFQEVIDVLGIPNLALRKGNESNFICNISPPKGVSNDMTTLIDNYGDWNNVTQSSPSGNFPKKHEHFGDGVELPNSYLAKFQRSALGHGQENSSITDIYSKNSGGSWEGHRTLYAPLPNKDLRGALVTVLPSGTVFICTAATDLSADYGNPYDPTPTEFKLGYIRNYRQADEEIVPLTTFFTNAYQYAQIRNVAVVQTLDGLKVEIGGFRTTIVGGVNQLEIFTLVGDYNSNTDTVENIQLGVPVFSGVNTLGVSEDARLRYEINRGISVIRSGGGLQQFKYNNGVWAYQGVIPDTMSNDVAPTLTLRRLNGVDYIVLCYNRRTGSQDRMRFRWAKASDVFMDHTKWTYGLFDPLPYDYQNASGYQSIVQLRSGRVVMFTHREFVTGNEAGQYITGGTPGPTQVRMHVVDLDSWISTENTWSPVLTATTPGGIALIYTEQAGRMTEVGNFVHLTFSLQTSNWLSTGAAGQVSISNLPARVKNLRAARAVADVLCINVRLSDVSVIIGGTTVVTHCNTVIGMLNNATGNIDLYKKTPNGIVVLTAAELQTNVSIICEVSYQRE